jgi:hypothetical protein
MNPKDRLEKVGPQIGAALVQEFQKAIDEHSASSDAIRFQCGLQAMSAMLEFFKSQSAGIDLPRK